MLVHECVAAFQAQPHGQAAAQAKSSSAVPTDRHIDIPYAAGTHGWQVLPTATAAAAAAAVGDAAVTVCEQFVLAALEGQRHEIPYSSGHATHGSSALLLCSFVHR
jgi:hypothetical protein